MLTKHANGALPATAININRSPKGAPPGPEVNFFGHQPLWQVDFEIHLPQRFFYQPKHFSA